MPKDRRACFRSTILPASPNLPGSPTTSFRVRPDFPSRFLDRGPEGERPDFRPPPADLDLDLPAPVLQAQFSDDSISPLDSVTRRREMSQLQLHKLEEQRRLLMERQDRLKVASPIAGKVITSEVRLLRRPVTPGHALITIQPPLVWNAALPLTVLTGVGFALIAECIWRQRKSLNLSAQQS